MSFQGPRCQVIDPSPKRNIEIQSKECVLETPKYCLCEDHIAMHINSTFFFTFPSELQSKLMMPLKYAEGIITAVVDLKTPCIHSFISFLTLTGTFICFLLKSLSCERQTTCSKSS